MKNISLLVFVFFNTAIAFAQNNIGIGTSSPNNSAMLDITSTTKGLLIPRMTTAQRNSIVSPAKGLMVFDNDTNSFWFYNGSTWTNIAANTGSGWALTGNSGTSLATDFIGTTDNQALLFKVNNKRFGFFDTNGSIAIGDLAGSYNYAHNNIAIGSKALFFNGSISNLVAVGDSALYNNGTGALAGDGVKNTAIGSKALFSNNTGSENTAIGYQTLYSNTNGDNNVAVGKEVLRLNTTGSFNTAMGSNALGKNISGISNTALGYSASLNNTTGFSNIALGTLALYANTTGYSNIAIGTNALSKNILSYQNISIGDSSLFNNGSGNINPNGEASYNISIGYKTLYNNTSGYYNVSIGNEAGYNITTGGGNTALGTEALGQNISGNNNTAVGAGSGVSAGNLLNTTAIGNAARVNASNKVVIGNSDVTSIGGYANWSNFSDARFKRNVKEDVPGIAFITKLRPVTYTLDVDAINDFNSKDLPAGKKINSLNPEKKNEIITGFMAQEVEQTARSLGFTFSGVDKPADANNQTYALRYSDFVVPLVKAVQEQQQQIEILTKEVADLKKLLQKQ
ncbi:MAG: tail fiber domain-containing protein [Chitinophagaceae bacterium]|nr:tail fiber domain-containing protein [Chitinophagaceae bacterium]